jgi:hypothetical protein
LDNVRKQHGGSVEYMLSPWSAKDDWLEHVKICTKIEHKRTHILFMNPASYPIGKGCSYLLE